MPRNKSERQRYAEAWEGWKRAVASGWGPVFKHVAKDIELPPQPPEPDPQAYFSLPRWSRIALKLGLVSERNSAKPKFKVGDTVKSDHGDVGTIEEIDRTHQCVFYGVRFNANDKRWLFEDALQVAPERELAPR